MKKALPLFIFVSFSLCGLAQQNTNRIEAAGGKVVGMSSSGGNKGYGIIYTHTVTTGTTNILTNTVASQGRTIYGAPAGSTLLRTRNGMLYGLTQYGGLFGLGSLYSYNPYTGKDSLMLSFNWVNGDQPQGALMLASNGLMYGTTLYGGSYGGGVLFSFDPVTGHDSVLVNLSDSTGNNPYYCKLVQAPNGLLYGMAKGGSHGMGAVFYFNPVTGHDSIIVNFDSANGKNPFGGLILANNNMLYGMTTFGGTHDSGTIFSINPSNNQQTVLYNLGNSSGGLPYGSLMQASNGLLYGMTNTGGANNKGTLFYFNISTLTDSVLLNFNGTNGQNPNGDNTLIQTPNGKLYGMTAAGGNATYPLGVLFSYDPVTKNDSIIENFTAGLAGGASGSTPMDGLVADTTGAIYGLTERGGTYVNGGTLFSYIPATKTFSTLVNLGGSGSNNGYLTQASNGYVYGMTSYGGIFSQGTLFRIDPNTGKDTIFHSFDFTDGAAPYGKLLQASDSNLYGTTAHGGVDLLHNYGTLFMFNPSTNVESAVLDFSSDPGGGEEPHGGLIQATDHLLYGMTMRSLNTGGYGVLYSFNPLIPHKDSVRIQFADTNGANPLGPVMQANNNLLYGMTLLGGSRNKGVLFSYNTVTGTDSTLVNFNDTNGAYPFGGLIQSSANNYIYGMTSAGGTSHKGVILRLNPATKADTVVLNFNGSNGAFPISSLIQDSVGTLYGTTRYGGTHNNGVLFRFNPITNQDTILFNFYADSGAYPTNIIFLSNIPTGINNVQQPKEVILVYPNPFTSIATVLFSTPGKHYVELDDMNGQKLQWLECTNSQCQISRKSLATGVYIVKVYNSDMKPIASSKLVVSGQ